MKGFAVFFVVLAFFNVQLCGQVPEKGLAAYYPFNGNALDESGNKNTGTVRGALLTSDRFGRSRSAYDFSNTALIDISDHGRLNISSDLTIVAWINSNSTSNYQKVVEKAVSGNIAYRFYFDGAQKRLVFNQIDRHGTPTDVASSTSALRANRWHFVACTREGDGTTPGSIKFYVDASFVGAGFSSTLPGSPSGNATISDRDMSRTGHFIGKLDDIGIYYRVLEDSELQQIYVSTAGSFSNPRSVPARATFSVDATALRTRHAMAGVDPLGFNIEYTFAIQLIDGTTKKELARWGHKGIPNGFTRASLLEEFQWPISLTISNLPPECNRVELKYLLLAQLVGKDIGLEQLSNCPVGLTQGSKSVNTKKWLFWDKKELNFGNIDARLECK